MNVNNEPSRVAGRRKHRFLLATPEHMSRKCVADELVNALEIYECQVGECGNKIRGLC